MSNFNINTFMNLLIALIGLIPTFASGVWLIVNTIKTKNWAMIRQFANSAMSEVESYSLEHPETTSQQKLNKAIDLIEEKCSAQGIKFNTALLSKSVSYIKEMCTWSKTVNASEGSNQCK